MFYNRPGQHSPLSSLEISVSVFQCRPGSPRCRGAARWRRGRGTPSVWGARPPGCLSPALPGTSQSGRLREVTLPVGEPAIQYPMLTSPPPATTSAPPSTVLVTPSTPPSPSTFSVSPRLWASFIRELSSHFIFNVGTHSQTFTNKIKTVSSIFETKTYYLFILNTKKKLEVFYWLNWYVCVGRPTTSPVSGGPTPGWRGSFCWSWLLRSWRTLSFC